MQQTPKWIIDTYRYILKYKYYAINLKAGTDHYNDVRLYTKSWWNDYHSFNHFQDFIDKLNK